MTENQPSPSCADEIQLKHTVFGSYDRDALLRCTETLLEQPSSSALAKDLVTAAVTRMSAWQWEASRANGRWIPTSRLQSNLTPDRRAFAPHNGLVSRNESAQVELLDLYRLYNILPSGAADYELAALSRDWQLFLVVVYLLTTITAFILNAVTVIVLTRSPESELRKFLINLSLSDVLMSCFSIPNNTEYMLGFWIFPRFLCPVGRFVVTLGVFVSVATMTVICINRHSAIMNPLKRKRPPKIRHWRVKRFHVILGIWLLGAAVASPDYLMFSGAPFCFNQQLYFQCRSIWPSWISDSYTIFIYIATFVVPLTVLSFLYSRMGLKLVRHQIPGNENINRDATMQMQRAKVVKMLLVVVLMFLISWLPIQTLSVLEIIFKLSQWFGNETPGSYALTAAYFTSYWLAMTHSCINPLIYGCMSKKFRSSLQGFLCAKSSSQAIDSAGNAADRAGFRPGAAQPHHLCASSRPADRNGAPAANRKLRTYGMVHPGRAKTAVAESPAGADGGRDNGWHKPAADVAGELSGERSSESLVLVEFNGRHDRCTSQLTVAPGGELGRDDTLEHNLFEFCRSTDSAGPTGDAADAPLIEPASCLHFEGRPDAIRTGGLQSCGRTPARERTASPDQPSAPEDSATV